MSKKKTDKRTKSSIELAAQSGASSEVVDRYCSFTNFVTLKFKIAHHEFL